MALHDHTYVGGIPTGNVVTRGQYTPRNVSPATRSLPIPFQYKSPTYLLQNRTWISVSVQVSNLSSTKPYMDFRFSTSLQLISQKTVHGFPFQYKSQNYLLQNRKWISVSVQVSNLSSTKPYMDFRFSTSLQLIS